MSEKRFRSHIDECGVYYYIYDKNKILAEAFYKDDAEEIVDLLNTLHEEKEFWKADACNSMNLHSMLSFEVGKLTETKDVDAFLGFYYKYFL